MTKDMVREWVTARYQTVHCRPWNEIAIPEKPEELAELLADDKRRAEVFGNAEATKDFLQKYVKVTNKSGDVGKQIADEVQKGIVEFLKDNGVNRPDLTNVEPSKAKGTAYNKHAIGTALDGQFADLPDFLTSIAPKASIENQQRWQKIKNDYSGVEPSAGGFLIGEVLRSELLRNSLETAIMRPRARVITMDNPSVPFPAIDETTRVGSVFGGITGTWVEEGAALPESEAKFGRVVLKANKLVTYCEVPNELVYDSPVAFGDFINQAMPEAISFFEDDAFINGTGVGQPEGWQNAAAAVVVAEETNQPNDTIVWENVVKMFARMLPSSLSRAIWVASIDTFPQLATMSLAIGTGGSAVWLNNGAAGPPMTILGRPVIFTEKTTILGEQGDLNFIDPAYYLIGDRQQIRVESSPHYKFGNDIVAYRVIERVDGRSWMLSSVTPKNGSANVSPFVLLGERDT